MKKIYALFGDDQQLSPFNLGSEAASQTMAQLFPALRAYRQFERGPKQLANLVLAPYLASAELWLDTADDAAEILGALRAAATTLPCVFARDPALLVESQEHNISGEPLNDSGFKATFLFNRKTSMDLQAFHSYWLNHHGPIAAKTQDAERYVQSHVCEPERVYDGITELFWRDHDTALASMASQQMIVDQSNDSQNFVDGGSLVVFLSSETP
ncbi:MAG: EthD domain-containing protein [Gammaproteobacteria bacterium]|nr:EthD domain-containing protein [Gammaproteobacteria bacterium]